MDVENSSLKGLELTKGFGDNFMKVEKVDPVAGVYRKPYLNKRFVHQ
jgi:hypothetical protein